MGTFNAHEVFPCFFFLLVKVVFPKKKKGEGGGKTYFTYFSARSHHGKWSPPQ